MASKGHPAAVQVTAHLGIDRTLVQAAAWNAATLRMVLTAEQPGDLFASDAPDRRSADRFSGGLDADAALGVEKMVAAAVLTGRGLPLLYFGQEVGLAGGAKSVRTEPGLNASSAHETGADGDAQSLLNWYQKLGGLRHTDAALRGGTLTLVETGYDEVVAWVRRGSSGQPLLVVCNLSQRPVVISLTAALHQLGLAASSGLQPLAMSFAGADTGYTASGISLPAFGTYVGEVHQPGLEAAAPVVVRRRRR